jgi:hypothetical protein
MSKVKDVFYAWASNDSGASMDIPHSRGNSKTHAIAESRRQMGSGWTIHIMQVFVDGGRGPKIPNPITTPAGGLQPRPHSQED